MKGLIDYENEDDSDEVERYKKRIMHVVARKGASYPSEIARQMPLDPGEVSPLIHDLLQDGHLMEIPIVPFNLDPRLRRRLPEMWRRGIQGEDEFRQIHWVGLAPNKILYHADGDVTDPIGREILDVDATFDETGGMFEFGAEA